MDWKNRKLEIGIGLMGLTLFSFIYFSSQQEHRPATGFFKNFQMGFEMPKFRNMLQFFTLDGREIDRHEQIEDETVSNGPAQPMKPTLVGKTINHVGQKLPVSNKDVKKTAAAQRGNGQANSRRPVMQVKNNGLGDRYKSAFANHSTDSTPQKEELPPTSSVSYYIPPNQEEPAAAKKEEKELGLEYWRQLLISSPTPATAYKIVDALSKKKITEKDFYTLTDMLLQSKTAGYQKLGLFMIYNQSSANAFTLVAKNYDSFSSDLVKTADNFLVSFNEPGKIGVLASALSSNQPKIQLRAILALVVGLENIRNGESPTPAGTRPGRGETVTKFDAKAYTQMLPQLNKLVLSTDGTISQAAFRAISLLSTVAGT